MERAPLLLDLELALAAQRQDVALHLDLDLILLEAGQLRRQDDPILVFDDVDRRQPVPRLNSSSLRGAVRAKARLNGSADLETHDTGSHVTSHP